MYTHERTSAARLIVLILLAWIIGIVFIVSIVANCWAVDYSADANCISAWPCLTGSGLTVTDVTANSNDASLHADSTWGTAGKPAAYLSYYVTQVTDGTTITAHSTINNKIFHYGTAFSASLWIYIDNWVDWAAILDKNNSAVGCDETDGRVSVVLDRVGGDMSRTTTTVFTADTWHHLAVTYDGGTVGTGIKIYRNGSECSYVSAADGADEAVSETADFYFWGSAGAKFSDVIIFSDVLTSEEVSDIYTNGIGYTEAPAATGAQVIICGGD